MFARGEFSDEEIQAIEIRYPALASRFATRRVRALAGMTPGFGSVENESLGLFVLFDDFCDSLVSVSESNPFRGSELAKFKATVPPSSFLKTPSLESGLLSIAIGVTGPVVTFMGGLSEFPEVLKQSVVECQMEEIQRAWVLCTGERGGRRVYLAVETNGQSSLSREYWKESIENALGRLV